jgi:hypothetical protein
MRRGKGGHKGHGIRESRWWYKGGPGTLTELLFQQGGALTKQGHEQSCMQAIITKPLSVCVLLCGCHLCLCLWYEIEHATGKGGAQGAWHQ